MKIYWLSRDMRPTLSTELTQLKSPLKVPKKTVQKHNYMKTKILRLESALNRLKLKIWNKLNRFKLGQWPWTQFRISCKKRSNVTLAAQILYTKALTRIFLVGISLENHNVIVKDLTIWSDSPFSHLIQFSLRKGLRLEITGDQVTLLKRSRSHH